MTTHKYANDAKGVLATGLNNTDDPAVFDLDPGQGALFPAAGGGDVFTLCLRDDPDPDLATKQEYLLVTDKSGDTLTATRAQEGSTKQSWVAGDSATGPLTVVGLEELPYFPTRAAFELEVHETTPLWAGTDIHLVLDETDDTTWIGRNSRTKADTYKDLSNNDPAVVMNNAMADLSSARGVLTYGTGIGGASILTKSQIEVPEGVTLKGPVGEAFSTGIPVGLAPAAPFAAFDAIVAAIGNGAKLVNVFAHPDSDADYGIYVAANDVVLDNPSTQDASLHGIHIAGSRCRVRTPATRQPNNLGTSFYVESGADVQITGGGEISGCGTGADDSALFCAGATLQVGGLLHVTGSAGANQVMIWDGARGQCVGAIELDGGSSIASGGCWLRIDSGLFLLNGMLFYGNQLAFDNTIDVIRQKTSSAILLQIINCRSVLANDGNRWRYFYNRASGSAVADLSHCGMGNIKAGNTPWNHEPENHKDNFLNGAAYDPSAPGDAGYLVTASHAGLSNEVVVGTTPGGELGGSWGTPTVDTTHSGSSHASIQTAAAAYTDAAVAAEHADMLAMASAAQTGAETTAEVALEDALRSVEIRPLGNTLDPTGLEDALVSRLVLTDATVLPGQLVMASATEGQVTPSTTEGDPVVGVALEAGGAGDPVLVAFGGVAQVLVAASSNAAPGDVMVGTTSGSAKKATTRAVTTSQQMVGVALETSAGGTTRLVWMSLHFAHILPMAQRTRTFTIAARPYMTADGATASTLGTLPDQVPTYRLDDGATQGAYCTFGIPFDAVSGQPLSAEVIWAPVSTDASAHSVRWSIDAFQMPDGANVGTAGTTTTWTGDAAARTATFKVTETIQQILASVNPGGSIRFNIRRVGADGADTYVGNLHLLDVRFSYTATS